ncbi:hypothetical protein [Herbaspirillum huttiense]|uniref:hypothetical protein n=1 Tax=Herbaspirillum huttiense TaxID=863372 RepID=UPI002E76BCBB|nr:hypothetical protein [Herbaspirillum huttiense]MEE1636394.1 hypothetical protein [Herbaspirillum huttiense NC40101]
MSRLTWRQEPRRKGLAGVSQGPRGYQMFYGTERIATVQHSRNGWFYYASSERHSVPHINTAGYLQFSSKEAARDHCSIYVRKHFKKESQQ